MRVVNFSDGLAAVVLHYLTEAEKDNKEVRRVEIHVVIGRPVRPVGSHVADVFGVSVFKHEKVEA